MNTPLPREIRQSWGLQRIKYRSRDDPSLTLDHPSLIESAMRYTRSKYHAGSTSMHMHNTHYVIYFATFYLLFLFSKSYPKIWRRPSTGWPRETMKAVDGVRGVVSGVEGLVNTKREGNWEGLGLGYGNVFLWNKNAQ